MEFTIKSRRFKRDINFFCNDFKPDAQFQMRFIFVDLNKQPGVLGNQLCEGGGLRGATVMAYSEKDFESTCRKWWKAYLRETFVEY